MYTLKVPTYGFHWPENGFVKTEACSQETNVLYFVIKPTRCTNFTDLFCRDFRDKINL